MNFRISLSVFACFFCCYFLQAQRIAPIDQWTAYVSHQNVVEITQKGDQLYCITEGGMFSLDINTNEVQTYSPIEGLSAIDPKTIYYDEGSDQVFIGFQDGMINYFSDPGSMQYITDINRTELFTAKGINTFAARDGLLYIATEFGVVIFDIEAEETRLSVTKISTNLTGSSVEDLTIANDTIYVAMGSKGLFKAPLNHPNLTVPTAWIKESGTNSLPVARSSYVTHAGTRIYAEVLDTIFYRDLGGAWEKTTLPKADYQYVSSTNDVFYAATRAWAYVFYPDGSTFFYNTFGELNSIFTDGGDVVWMGDKKLGLRKEKDLGINEVGPEGPLNNFVTEIAAGNGEFYVAPRGKQGSSNRYFDRSGIYYFSYKNGGWDNSNNVNGKLSTDEIWLDFARAYLHEPSGRAFLASWGEGVVELKDGQPVKNYMPTNSGLSPSLNQIGDSSARCSGVVMDDEQNLWITQYLGDYLLNVRTNDGQWYNYFTSGISPIGIIVDDFGNKWINNQGQGIVVFNENGTYANTSDDQVKYLINISGQGGLPNNSVNSIAKDNDGHIWVGTTEGVVVFYDPGSIWNAGYPDASCPVIDGFCLLRDQKVTDIAVDGANRKWISTENGVYLVSEDGTEQIAHYTQENSPLFDDEVKTIAIDNSTGEVLIGTNKGILSIMGSATGGADKCNELSVFPNPVQGNYDGVVSINGSVAESVIKITNVSGIVVKEIESLGGQAVWDMTDAYGNRVRPGIYLLLTGDKDGENACISKVAILDR